MFTSSEIAFSPVCSDCQKSVGYRGYINAANPLVFDEPTLTLTYDALANTDTSYRFILRGKQDQFSLVTSTTKYYTSNCILFRHLGYVSYYIPIITASIIANME